MYAPFAKGFLMIFDTDVLIWAFRGNTRTAAAIDGSESLELSVVSYMELVRGARDKGELQSPGRPCRI